MPKVKGGRHHKQTKLERRQEEYDRYDKTNPSRRRPGSTNKKK